MREIAEVLIQFITVYRLLLLGRILLSWLPNLDWYKQPFRFIAAVTDPVMEPFRRLIPPLGGIDFSPIILFFLLSLLQDLLFKFAVAG